MNIIKFFKWLLVDQFIFGFGGGGGGGGQPTQSTATSYQTNIPEYARPYVETMLGATQKQLFTMDGSDITGFRPYQPYSTDPTQYVAPFSPLQQQAQQAAAQLTVPQQYQQATGLAGLGAMGSLGLAGQMAGTGAEYAQQATTPSSMQAYMSPYMQNVVDYQKAQALRDYQIGKPLRQAQAVGQGAFGGSRQAIQEAEAQRNLMSQLQGIEATGAQAAFQNAQQAQQFGAQLGLQGRQAGLGGLGQTIAGAGQLGQLGTAQLGAQQNILGTQASMGAQQQAMQQQIINQAVQDWANAQQYPLMQLGVMSNMLRGLPMQAATTQQYVAAPNALTQGIGTIGSLGFLGKALAGKEGGLPSEFKSEGGIKSYSVGGSVKSKLYNMSPAELQDYIEESSSPMAREMAQEILRDKTGKASGGIIAFQNRGLVPGFAEESLTMPKGDLPVQREESKEEKIMREYRERQAAEANRVTPYQQLKDYLGKAKEASTERAVAYSTPVSETRTKDQIIADAQKQNAQVQADPNLSKEDKAKIQERTNEGIAIVKADPNIGVKPPPAPASAAPPAGIKTAPSDKIMFTGINIPREPALPGAADVRQELAEKEAYMGPNVAAQKARAAAMAERANVEDEKKRMFDLRMAEFFAAWGSTPGNSIVAGLNALKTKIPDIISDTKEAAKVRRAIDKDIAEIDKAARLEKSGDYDAAQKIINDRARLARETWAEKLRSYTTIKAASIRAEATGDTSGVKYSEYQRKVLQLEDDTKKGKDYQDALRDSKLPVKPDSSEAMKKKQREGREKIDKYEADFAQRRKDANITESPSAAPPAPSAGKLVQNKDGTFTYQPQ